MIPQKTWKKVEHLRESPKILENLQKSPRLGTVGQATRNVCQNRLVRQYPCRLFPGGLGVSQTPTVVHGHFPDGMLRFVFEMTSAIGGVGEHSARSGSDVFVIRIGDLEIRNLKI